jgi:hypothetical protein
LRHFKKGKFMYALETANVPVAEIAARFAIARSTPYRTFLKLAA